jgi:DNA-binding GntR family transcriptional regulator
MSAPTPRKSAPASKTARTSTKGRAPRADKHATMRKETLTEQAYAQIEEAIVTLQIPPGSIVSELSLSEMTGIGRTPIREAIQQLAREHLILILPQRGLLVPEIDVKKQLKLLRTRREVERLVCRQRSATCSRSWRQSSRKPQRLTTT